VKGFIAGPRYHVYMRPPFMTVTLFISPCVLDWCVRRVRQERAVYPLAAGPSEYSVCLILQVPRSLFALLFTAAIEAFQPERTASPHARRSRLVLPPAERGVRRGVTFSLWHKGGRISVAQQCVRHYKEAAGGSILDRRRKP